MVLGSIDDGEVILEVKDSNKSGQLWIKGEENPEGYFNLENSKFKDLLRSDYDSASGVTLKGYYKRRDGLSKETQYLYTKFW